MRLAICQLHQGLFDKSIVPTDTQLKDNYVPIMITPKEFVCLTTFILKWAVFQ